MQKAAEGSAVLDGAGASCWQFCQGHGIDRLPIPFEINLQLQAGQGRKDNGWMGLPS